MAEHMRTLNPNVSVVEIPDAGHYVHDDQPRQFATVVGGFLKHE
jgi:pimeloyl-ACP methyl ester carboxylesterase